VVRTVASLAAAFSIALTATAAQAQSLVGTWSTTIDWNEPSGIMITSSFTADGHLQATTQNHMGQSYMLAGIYQLSGGVLQFKWTDYAPKQICAGYCTPAPPPAPLGVVNSESIRFLNPNQFVATAQGGSAVYVRTSAAGFPGQ
jgi:hypothetical protein